MREPVWVIFDCIINTEVLPYMYIMEKQPCVEWKEIQLWNFTFFQNSALEEMLQETNITNFDLEMTPLLDML